MYFKACQDRNTPLTAISAAYVSNDREGLSSCVTGCTDLQPVIDLLGRRARGLLVPGHPLSASCAES